MGGKGPRGNVVASVLCSVMTHGLLVFFAILLRAQALNVSVLDSWSALPDVKGLGAVDGIAELRQVISSAEGLLNPVL